MKVTGTYADMRSQMASSVSTPPSLLATGRTVAYAVVLELGSTFWIGARLVENPTFLGLNRVGTGYALLISLRRLLRICQGR